MSFFYCSSSSNYYCSFFASFAGSTLFVGDRAIVFYFLRVKPLFKGLVISFVGDLAGDEASVSIPPSKVSTFSEMTLSLVPMDA